MTAGRLSSASFAAVLTAHLLVAAWPHAPALLRGQPSTWAEHGRQLLGARTTLRVLESTGSRWGYDPTVLCGVPNAAISTDSHAQSLVVLALAPLGVERAYALWAILAAAVTPLLVALAGRACGAPAPAAGLAALLLLQLDPLARQLGRTGIHAWLLAAAVTVLFQATFAALLDAAVATRRQWLAVGALLPLLSVHILCPPTVAAAFVVALALRLARPDGRRAAAARAAGVAAAGLLVNLWWVGPLLRHWWIFEAGDLHTSLNVAPSQALHDLLSVAVPGAGYLSGTLGLRWALLAAGLWAGARPGASAPARAVALLAAVLLVVAYVGGLVPGLRTLQAHRFVVVAALGAAALAGAGLACAVAAWRSGGRARSAPAALALAALLSIGWEGRAALAEPLRPRALERDDLLAVRALAATSAREGRLLVELMRNRPYVANAAALALEDRVHVAISAHELFGRFGRVFWYPARFLGQDPARTLPGEVPALLERYAVTHLLVRSRWGFDLLDAAPPGTFSAVEAVGAWRLYRVARPAGWFVEGGGRLEAAPGRLRLTELTGPVTVRFQHVPGLRALEEGPLVTSRPSGGPLPFIRVDPRGAAAVTLVWDG